MNENDVKKSVNKKVALVLGLIAFIVYLVSMLLIWR